MQSPRVRVGALYRTYGQYGDLKFVPNGGIIEVEGSLARYSFTRLSSSSCGMCGALKGSDFSLWCNACWLALRKACDKCGALKDSCLLVRVSHHRRLCQDCAYHIPECVCCVSKNIANECGGQLHWSIWSTDSSAMMMDLCPTHLWIPDCYRCKREIDTPREMCYYYAVGVPDVRLRQRRMYKVFCKDCCKVVV